MWKIVGNRTLSVKVEDLPLGRDLQPDSTTKKISELFEKASAESYGTHKRLIRSDSLETCFRIWHDKVYPSDEHKTTKHVMQEFFKKLDKWVANISR